MLKQVFKIIFALVLLVSLGDAVTTKTSTTFPPQAKTEERININTASIEELKRLPGVGQKLAERIIAHRTKHGTFKRPQDIVIVRGFSANRYRRLAHLIRI